MSLDVVRDYAIEAIAALCKGTVNAKLEPVLGENAINKTFGAPLPLPLLPAPVFPALCIYRLNDRDKDRGDWIFEDVSTFRFDYYVGPTPIDRIDQRWPLLREVWEIMLAVLRVGRDPSVAEEAEILKTGGVTRYVLGSARNEYLFAPANSQAYPMLRGNISFDTCYPSPDSFYDNLDKSLRLDTFEGLDVDWNIALPDNPEIEARSEIALPQS